MSFQTEKIKSHHKLVLRINFQLKVHLYIVENAPQEGYRRGFFFSVIVTNHEKKDKIFVHMLMTSKIFKDC